MSAGLEDLSQALEGRYRIDREVGRGGMAAVYLAHDVRHDRTVAIKVLRPDPAMALGAERFLREIAVTARLDHPHILPLLDSGSEGGFLYYVMPFVQGESLRDRVKRERQLPLDEAVAITREVADALHYAHGLGIVHRDVKPENILLAGGHARLADFGIARVVNAMQVSNATSLTGTGMVIGTTTYMSPEQASGSQEVNARSDIYSLAAVAYEMLSGQPPHAGATAEVVLRRKLREPVSSLTVIRDGIPPAIDSAIRRALSRTPADRFSTASQFSEAIARGTQPGTSGPDQPYLSGDEPTRMVDAVAVGASAPRPVLTMMLAGVALALGVAAVSWFFWRNSDNVWLKEEALPKLEAALDTADFETAYMQARAIASRVPDAPELADVWPRLSWRVTIASVPEGAVVRRRSYAAAEGPWEELGRTPLTNVRFPFGLSRLRLELDGYRPLERALGGAHLNWEELRPVQPDMLLVGPEPYELETAVSAPADKVRVAGWTFPLEGRTLRAESFLLGRYEVTNAEFKAFVDAGGYRRADFWDAIEMNGRALPWPDAMRLFVDQTGRPGPSTWQAGDYVEGHENHPVAGVSWYEAAAYARFAGQELPTAIHWQQALANSMFPWLLPVSNFSGKGPRAVSESRAMTHVGAYDMTGNVREWTKTAIGQERVILGGSWNDPYYIAGAAETTARPLDRSAGNGLRLAVTQDAPDVAAQLRAPASRTAIPSSEYDPVPDPIYSAYGRVFDYRKGPLNASVTGVDRKRIWTRERVEFDAGYGNERVILHLYVPATGRAPYRTVVYWPGWDTFELTDVDEYFSKQLDFLVKNGWAVAFPVYKGIFERRVGSARLPPFNTAEYRDNAIESVKDLRRTIDYLETRADIDSNTLSFFGYSWGGVNGPLALAHEPRLRTAIIDIGLLPVMTGTPEVDPVNALPRVRQPTLMFSGEFDPMVPLANARRYFSLLGASPSNKRHSIVVGGHFIPRELLIRETLEWLDAHK
jgi:formylglycine-generating enzyme required for sulfatase activity/dienelactone hydrolase